MKILVSARAYELAFDWKSQLPPPSEDSGKNRLVEESVAMANAGGGFLIFGVHDDQNLDPLRRICGLDRDQEFAKRLGDMLHRADPAVPYTMGVPVDVVHAPGKVLHVAEILGFSRPHSFKGTFFRRSTRGADQMTTREVTDLIVRREEIMSKVRLLILELVSAREAGLAACVFVKDRNSTIVVRPIAADSISALQATLAPILAADLSSRLIELRASSDGFSYALTLVGSAPNPIAAAT